MTIRQKLELRASEIRHRLGEIAALEGDARTDPVAGEQVTLMTEIREIEPRLQAAIASETADERLRNPGDGSNTEIANLEGRCSVAGYLNEAATGNGVDGAEREYRTAVMGDAAAEGLMPVRMLGDRILGGEHRAVTPVAAGAVSLGSQADVLARVFERSIASELGVSMPSVPMGERGYPVMLTGSTVSQQAKGGEQAATAGSFGGFNLSPLRLTGSYEFNVEDLQLLRGLEDTLRRDLRASLQDKMDDQLVNGNGAAPNVNGFLSELSAPAAEGARATFASYVKAFTSQVDGLNAYDIAELRAVISQSTYSDMEGFYRAAGTEQTSYSELRRRGVGIRVSHRMPATPTQGTLNKNDTLILSKTGYPGTNAIAPIWSGIQLIRDIYTKAESGQVRVTMLMLWNFKVVREAGWSLVARQVVA